MGRRPIPAGKLLDQWIPPDGSGEAVGCVSTSYTFDSVFFEDECLTRFAQVESDPDEDGPAYLIEREEKLAGLECAAVLVDQHHCKGQRSLRWDLIPVRVPGGIMHAKLSLLFWTGCVRLLVASANLTPDGYRRNQEIVGVLEYVPRPGAIPGWLTNTLDFLASVVEQDASRLRDAPDLERVRLFLTRVGAAAERAPAAEAEEEEEEGPRVVPVYLRPYSEGVLEQLARLWHGSGAIENARVTSPFYDEPTAPASPNLPARRLWDMLKKRGAATVAWCAPGQRRDDGESVLLSAPVEALRAAQPGGRVGVSTTFLLAKEQGLDRDGDVDAFRPLHMKSIVLSDDDHALLMMGSSNFTTPGLGLGGKVRNVEANLAYLVRRRDEREWRALDETGPECEELPAGKVEGASAADPDGEGSPREPGLPGFFQSAVFDVNPAGGFLVRLRFLAADRGPDRWTVRLDNDDVVCSNISWAEAGRPEHIEVPMSQGGPPSGLWVLWVNGKESVRSWWPVVVARAATLPPPSELRDLPLQALLDVVTSARPVHVVLGQWLSRNASTHHGAEPAPIIDPLKRVDSSEFILQRTRRVCWALGALRQRLEKPCATREQLAWRLEGPVGVGALAAAIEREAQTAEERVFLLAELGLELSRVQPVSTPGGLGADEVMAGIGEVIARLESRATAAAADADRGIAEYARLAFEEARR